MTQRNHDLAASYFLWASLSSVHDFSWSNSAQRHATAMINQQDPPLRVVCSHDTPAHEKHQIACDPEQTTPPTPALSLSKAVLCCWFSPSPAQFIAHPFPMRSVKGSMLHCVASDVHLNLLSQELLCAQLTLCGGIHEGMAGLFPSST